MNADGVQTEGKGNDENRIKNAKSPPTQSVKTVSPEENVTGGIGKMKLQRNWNVEFAMRRKKKE